MDSNDKKRIGFADAIHGIKYVFSQERNFRIHLLAFIAVIPAAIVFDLSTVEWMMILFVSTVVFAMEILNSAIERVIDYVKPDVHPMAKNIKDMAAGAVLVASIGALIIGCMIFFPKIIALL